MHMRSWIGRACAAALVAGSAWLAGCGGENLFGPGLQAPAGPSLVLDEIRVVDLELTAGADQVTTPGTALSGIVVRALNASGGGVPGVEVQGQADPGDGTISPNRVTTGADGSAAFTWNVPSLPGVVEATFRLVADTTISVRASALVERE